MTARVSVQRKIGRKVTYEYVDATLITFPKESILKGVEAYNKLRKGSNDTVEKYRDLCLANHNDKWWLYYINKDSVTGSFDSKERAIAWFEHAGR